MNKIILSAALFLTMSAGGYLYAHAGTLDLEQPPQIQYGDPAPPPAPDTPEAPGPGDVYDPALSEDTALDAPDPALGQESVVSEPDPVVEEGDPLVEQPEPLVEEPEPLVDEPEAVVPEGEPLADEEAEGRGIR